MSLSTTQYGYIVDPMVPFTDDKGKTIKNGFIRVFMAGTSTPVLTYRNYDGATNQEKIELDNSGRVKYNVIGSKGSLYKVVVYDAHHSQETPILTVDKIAVLGASINATGATIVTGLDSVTVQEENFLKATVEGTGVELALDPTEVTSEVSTTAAAVTAAPDYVVPLLDKTGEGDSKKISLANLFKFALDWISRLATTITSFASGDVIAVSNPTDGTRKMSKDTLLTLTSQNALAGNVAQAFDPTRTSENPYKIGELCVYDGKVKIFKNNHYGSWTAGDAANFNLDASIDKTISNFADFNAVVKNILVTDSVFITFNSSAIVEVHAGRKTSDNKYRVGFRLWSANYGLLLADYTVSSATPYSDLPNYLEFTGLKVFFDFDHLTGQNLDFTNFSRFPVKINPITKDPKFFYIANSMKALEKAEEIENAFVQAPYPQQLIDAANVEVKNFYMYGNVAATSSATRSIVVKVEPDTQYTFSIESNSYQRLAVATFSSYPAASDVCLSSFGKDTTKTDVQYSRDYWTFTTPSACEYILIYYYNSNYDANTEAYIRETLMLSVGDEIEDYTAYSTYPVLKNSATPTVVLDAVKRINHLDRWTSRSMIFGVEFDTTSSTSVCRRIANSVGLKTNYAVGNALVYGYQNDFDTIYPWCEIKRCNIDDGKIVAYDGDAGFAVDGSNGDVMVEIPKFYSFREVVDGVERILVSGEKKPGFSCEPAFVKPDGTELDFVYVGAYSTSENANKSESGAFPSTYLTMHDYILNASSKGMSVYDIDILNMLQKLILVENGDKGISKLYEGYGHLIYQGSCTVGQSVASDNTVFVYGSNLLQMIRVGQWMMLSSDSVKRQVTAVTTPVYDSVTYHAWTCSVTLDGDPFSVVYDPDNKVYLSHFGQPNGGCDAMTYHTGRAGENGITAVRYRWMENLWGNVWMQTAGVRIKDLHYYITHDPSKIESDLGEFTELSFVSPEQRDWPTTNTGFVQAMGFDRAERLTTLPVAVGSEYENYEAKHYALKNLDPDGRTIPNGVEFVCVSGGGWDHINRNSIFTTRFWAEASSGAKSTLYGSRLVIRTEI